jgi:hypothetical protein
MSRRVPYGVELPSPGSCGVPPQVGVAKPLAGSIYESVAQGGASIRRWWHWLREGAGGAIPFACLTMVVVRCVGRCSERRCDGLKSTDNAGRLLRRVRLYW